MARRRKDIAAFIAALLGVAIGGLAPSTPLRILGVALAVAAVLYQFMTTGSVVKSFNESDWVETAEGMELHFSKGSHGRKAPVIQVYRRDKEGHFQEVICEVKSSKDGDVRIIIGRPPGFAGQVRIS